MKARDHQARIRQLTAAHAADLRRLQAQHTSEVAGIRLVHAGELAELETIIARLNRRLDAVARSDQGDHGPDLPQISAAGDLE